jgi:hypothetical protein
MVTRFAGIFTMIPEYALATTPYCQMTGVPR